MVTSRLVDAHVADAMGNLVYRKTARNFGPVMAAAAALTIAEVSEVVRVGDLDPENVVTPSIYVNRVLDLSGAAATRGSHPEPARTEAS